MKLFLLLLMVSFSCGAFAQRDSLGLFDSHADIGHPKNAGSSSYDRVTHTYTMKGSGYNIWFNRDEFQYLYKKLSGDFTLTANFEFIGDKGNNHRKIGWMIRETTDDDAVHISAVEHGDGLTVMQWRVSKGDSMRDPAGEIFFPDKNFETIQVQRVGNTVTMRVGHVGGPLRTVGSHTMARMPKQVLAGLFICSHDPEVIEQARIWDVHIETPSAK